MTCDTPRAPQNPFSLILPTLRAIYAPLKVKKVVTTHGYPSNNTTKACSLPEDHPCALKAFEWADIPACRVQVLRFCLVRDSIDLLSSTQNVHTSSRCNIIAICSAWYTLAYQMQSRFVPGHFLRFQIDDTIKYKTIII